MGGRDQVVQAEATRVVRDDRPDLGHRFGSRPRSKVPDQQQRDRHECRDPHYERDEPGAGAPELLPDPGAGPAVSNVLRRVSYGVSRALPGGIHTPFAFNLQAYARQSEG